MELDKAIKEINSINGKIDNFLNMETKAIDRLGFLESKVANIENIFSRPEVGVLGDYLRREEEPLLTVKSFDGRGDSGGVTLVPELDRKILSEMRARSPMRKLASVQTISSGSLEIVAEEGNFASGWVADFEERPETKTSKLAKTKITVHELYAQPKASQSLLDDSELSLQNWIIEKLTDSFVKSENEAFIKGDGKNKPFGILSPDRKIEEIKATDKLTPKLLLDAINSVPEEYLPGAAFLMNRATLSEIIQFTDSNGRFIWQSSMSEAFKETIFGLPVLCCSHIPASQEKGKSVILFGDFKSAYRIVDRKGINVMQDPYTDKPFVRFYGVKRVGGDLIDRKALRKIMF